MVVVVGDDDGGVVVGVPLGGGGSGADELDVAELVGVVGDDVSDGADVVVVDDDVSLPVSDDGMVAVFESGETTTGSGIGGGGTPGGSVALAS